MDACLLGSPLWRNLRRAQPKTLAEAMRIANKYTIGDPTHEGKKDNSAFQHNRNDRNDFRNKRRDPDFRYPQNQIAAVQEVQKVQPDVGNHQWQKISGPGYGQRNDGKKTWVNNKKSDSKEKYSFEAMLDQPCKFHSAGKPANHTTRNCFCMQKMGKGARLPSPPPPATGANALTIRNRQPNSGNHHQQQAVNQVANTGNPNGQQAGPSTRDQYQEHHASYRVFTT